MADTVKDALNRANPNDLAANLRRLWSDTNSTGFGDLLDGFRPRLVARTGLTSAAAHVHNSAALIASVNSTAGTPLAIVHGDPPDAGEVRIEYDATTGVPTLTFAAAVTAYTVSQIGPFPQNLSAALATEIAT